MLKATSPKWSEMLSTMLRRVKLSEAPPDLVRSIESRAEASAASAPDLCSALTFPPSTTAPTGSGWVIGARGLGL